MTLYKICHQSGRVLFTTDNEVTARNREQFGWKVIKVDKSREQFEKWFSKSYSCIAKLFRLNSEGEYENLTIRASWRAWQASRAAIEIELPEVCSCCYSESEKEWHDSVISEVTDILSAAGIKVKE